jgi:hypothetical protein
MQSAAVCFYLSSTYQIRNIIAGRGISRHSLAQEDRLFIIREYAQFGSAGLQQQETPPFDRISQIHSIKDIVPKNGQWEVFQSQKLFYYSSLKRIVLEAGAPPTTEVTGLRA